MLSFRLFNLPLERYGRVSSAKSVRNGWLHSAIKYILLVEREDLHFSIRYYTHSCLAVIH